MATPQERVQARVEAEVGYYPTNGKHNKYAQALDKTEAYNGAKDGYDWCDIFSDWSYITEFGFENAIKMINQPKRGCGAGCSFSASYYRAGNQWSSTPSVGSQIFFGAKGSESHTGIVVGYDETYVYTVEGNTGYSRGYNGGAVLDCTHRRNASNIVGYGVPKWSLAGGSDTKVEQTNTLRATGKLEPDKYIGVQSVTALQQAMGTTVDGSITGQDSGSAAHLPRLVAVVYDGGGSELVRAIQTMLRAKGYGINVDGYLGPKTIVALQRWLMSLGYDLAGDRIGYLDPETAGAIQLAYNDGEWKK